MHMYFSSNHLEKKKGGGGGEVTFFTPHPSSTVDLRQKKVSQITTLRVRTANVSTSEHFQGSHIRRSPCLWCPKKGCNPPPLLLSSGFGHSRSFPLKTTQTFLTHWLSFFFWRRLAFSGRGDSEALEMLLCHSVSCGIISTGIFFRVFAASAFEVMSAIRLIHPADMWKCLRFFWSGGNILTHFSS